jgi:CBS domain-containing protein
MTDMKRILDGKGYSFFFIPPDSTVLEAVHLMERKKVGFLLVMDGERLEGVLSERDVVWNMARSGPAFLERKALDAMVTPVYHVGLRASVDEVMGLMTERGIRHVPVMDDGMVVGVVSIRDVVKEVVADREVTIKGLENYIVGGDFAT